MPVFLDTATTEILYHNDDRTLTYGREWWLNGAGGDRLILRRLDDMVNYGILNNSDIIVVGSGFGFLIELGMADPRFNTSSFYGVEPGSFFWDPAQDAEWDPVVKALTVNDYLQSPTIRQSLNAIGLPGQARADFVIDEDAITMHSDAELTEFLDACEARLQGGAVGRIVHIVSTTVNNTNFDSLVNAKSLQQWHDVRPQHTWIESQTGIAMRNGTVI